jgi:hypothetical protein
MQVRGDQPDRPAEIGLGQVERSRRRGREAFDAQLGIEKDGGDVGAFDEIRQIVAVADEILQLVGQQPIQRANFMVGGVELPEARVRGPACPGCVPVGSIGPMPAGARRPRGDVSRRSDPGRGAVAAGGHWEVSQSTALGLPGTII